MIDRARLAACLASERALHFERTPASRAAFDASLHLVGRVPMPWMNAWPGGYPLYLAGALSNRVADVDGHEYIDFALGDSAAMAGHSPPAAVAAVIERIEIGGGIATTLPSVDAEWVGAELTRRFGLGHWSFCLSGTDASRRALHVARMITDRAQVMSFAHSPALDSQQNTLVVEFNDIESVELALAKRDVGAVFMEPALTDIGIVLPQPGFLDAVRAACTKSGTLFLVDETRTFAAGPGGCTGEWRLQPDIVVVGDSIGGGIPCGAYGMSDEVTAAVVAHLEVDLADVGGAFDGTLAGNAMSTAAMRATLGCVLTEDAFAHMIDMATRFTDGVSAAIHRYDLAWSIVQLGARTEYRFCHPTPTSGTESAAAHDGVLDEYLHLFMSNRGVLTMPVGNTALMCPGTAAADVDRHTELFDQAVANLV